MSQQNPEQAEADYQQWVARRMSDPQQARIEAAAESERTRQRAAALAWARGCVQENPCWPECLEAALETIVEGELDEWERTVATVKQYRIYTGQRIGGTDD